MAPVITRLSASWRPPLSLPWSHTPFKHRHQMGFRSACICSLYAALVSNSASVFSSVNCKLYLLPKVLAEHLADGSPSINIRPSSSTYASGCLSLLTPRLLPGEPSPQPAAEDPAQCTLPRRPTWWQEQGGWA